MTAGDDHDKTLQGIRKTIEELRATRLPSSSSSTSGKSKKQPSPEADRPAAEKTDRHIIPVIEEQPRVTKEVKETASLTFRKKVHAEDITVDDSVSHEEVSIERVPVERRYVDENPPGIQQQGNTTIVPIFHEVVEKQLILAEEIRITKRKRHAIASEPLSLYKEEIDIKRDTSQDSSAKDGIENRDQV
jgi:stress response protein YsnF